MPGGGNYFIMKIGDFVQIREKTKFYPDIDSVFTKKYGKIINTDSGVMFLVQLNVGYTIWSHQSSLKVVPESEFLSSCVLES
jgi:hypothetical protein